MVKTFEENSLKNIIFLYKDIFCDLAKKTKSELKF